MEKVDYRTIADNIITAITGYTYAKSYPISSYNSFLSQLNSLLPDDVKEKLYKEMVKDKQERAKIQSIGDLYDRFKTITNFPDKDIEEVEKDVSTNIKASMLMAEFISSKNLSNDFSGFEDKVLDELKSIQEFKNKLVNIATKTVEK